ncbi:hypothetical protein [Amorphus orientalis]|uniref:Uncharacterized protein n=1 Tax=Amorphus orientalis TaxID=649198 RepID=A0AAE3VQ20_9HYPH|nr:hypothetical protein [Amorphus orientalis]MDQ0316055.1 hypothetical protein [Amorphus orientalis]
MSGHSKHPKRPTPPDRDLNQDPGIGRSKGADMGKADPEDIEGDNTFEGDVENDPNRIGKVDPERIGRRNK